jgi:hypothetical protein
MTNVDDEGDKLARSFLESQRLNRLADYVSRGRKFGALTIDAVEDGWRATMKAMSHAPSERAHRDLNSEYEAELERSRVKAALRFRKGRRRTIPCGYKENH